MYSFSEQYTRECSRLSAKSLIQICSLFATTKHLALAKYPDDICNCTLVNHYSFQKTFSVNWHHSAAAAEKRASIIFRARSLLEFLCFLVSTFVLPPSSNEISIWMLSIKQNAQKDRNTRCTLPTAAMCCMGDGQQYNLLCSTGGLDETGQVSSVPLLV